MTKGYATHCRNGHEYTVENIYFTSDGFRHCRQCAKIRENNPAIQKRKRDLRYQREYDITYEEVEAMAIEQKFQCLSCKDPCTFETRGRGAPGAFALDHCHDTGIVRGLLCHRCNKVLGLIKDDVELLYALSDYLKMSLYRL